MPPATTGTTSQATTSPLETGKPAAAATSPLTPSAAATPGPVASIAGALTTSGSTPTLDGTTTEVYDRVARHALVCWFGAKGPLKGSHIFHADVPSPSEKRDVDITIHERDTTGQANPRGTRAFRIALAAEAEARTRMTMQVGKMPADLATAMERDAVAWAHGKETCDAQVVRPPPPPPPEPATPKKRGRKKL